MQKFIKTISNCLRRIIEKTKLTAIYLPLIIKISDLLEADFNV